MHEPTGLDRTQLPANQGDSRPPEYQAVPDLKERIARRLAQSIPNLQIEVVGSSFRVSPRVNISAYDFNPKEIDQGGSVVDASTMLLQDYTGQYQPMSVLRSVPLPEILSGMGIKYPSVLYPKLEELTVGQASRKGVPQEVAEALLKCAVAEIADVIQDELQLEKKADADGKMREFSQRQESIREGLGRDIQQLEPRVQKVREEVLTATEVAQHSGELLKRKDDAIRVLERQMYQHTPKAEQGTTSETSKTTFISADGLVVAKKKGLFGKEYHMSEQWFADFDSTEIFNMGGLPDEVIGALQEFTDDPSEKSLTAMYLDALEEKIGVQFFWNSVNTIPGLYDQARQLLRRFAPASSSSFDGQEVLVNQLMATNPTEAKRLAIKLAARAVLLAASRVGEVPQNSLAQVCFQYRESKFKCLSSGTIRDSLQTKQKYVSVSEPASADAANLDKKQAESTSLQRELNAKKSQREQIDRDITLKKQELERWVKTEVIEEFERMCPSMDQDGKYPFKEGVDMDDVFRKMVSRSKLLFESYQALIAGLPKCMASHGVDHRALFRFNQGDDQLVSAYPEFLPKLVAACLPADSKNPETTAQFAATALQCNSATDSVRRLGGNYAQFGYRDIESSQQRLHEILSLALREGVFIVDGLPQWDNITFRQSGKKEFEQSDLDAIRGVIQAAADEFEKVAGGREYTVLQPSYVENRRSAEDKLGLDFYSGRCESGEIKYALSEKATPDNMTRVLHSLKLYNSIQPGKLYVIPK